MKKLKTNKGYTMVEVVVATFLASLLMLTVIGMILSISNIVLEMEKQVYQYLYVESIYSYIDDNLKYSKYIELTDKTIYTDEYLCIKNNVLYHNGVEVPFVNAFLGDISLNVVLKDSNIMFLSVLLSKDDVLITEVSGLLKLKGLDYFSIDVVGEKDFEYINPIISFH